MSIPGDLPRHAARPAAPAPYDRRSRERHPTTHATPVQFDPVTTPVEPGIHLVEASAGTGKTFSIALSVLRLLLDSDPAGRPLTGGIGKILVVTFTNAATDELITRVRTMLRDAIDVFSGAAQERTDARAPLFALLDSYGPGGTPRLREAFASLDQLAIFTIHGFCKRVLDECALESGTPCDASFLEDDSLVMERVARDWWRRTIYEDRDLAALAVYDDLSPDSFLDLLKAYRRFPDTRVEPSTDLATARERLRMAMAMFAGTWDPARAAELLDSITWLSSAPLGGTPDRARAIENGTAFASGDLAAGLRIASVCTTIELQKYAGKRSADQKARRERIPHEPFVLACDAVMDAIEQVSAAVRTSYILDVSRAFDAEKDRMHLLGFDDLLARLRDALAAEESDGPLATAIRRRYDAALIDEFQDTDPYQFPIFARAFEGRPLFLIGDPKQAIYGFRGADVFAYMRAAEAADNVYTLTRNWRGTPRMVAAVNTLFGRLPNPFLFDHIGFTAAAAAADPPDPLAGDTKGAMHWWFVPPAGSGGKATPLAKGAMRERILRALARECVRLVESPGQGGMALAPGRIAVLVRDFSEANEVQRTLRGAGIPCVVAKLGDVLHSRELRELELILRAVLVPRDSRAVRAALATELWGMSAGEIHSLGGADRAAEWEDIVQRLAAARDTWVGHGFMRMVQELLLDRGVSERILAYDDGDRRATNLRQSVELLHATAREQRLSPEGLALWIERARAAKRSDDSRRTELRLESDADAVQIVTIHGSKGLEYDAVFVPGLWSRRHRNDGEPLLAHLDDGSVVLDHGSPPAERVERAAAESLAEDLRLTYVALTRARLRCYVAWGAVQNGQHRSDAAWRTGLGYLLRPEFVAGPAAEIAEHAAESLVRTIGEWQATLEALVFSSEGVMSMEILDGENPVAVRWTGADPAITAPRCLEVVFRAPQLETWRVASFTSLTASRHTDDSRDVGDDPAMASAISRTAVLRDDFMSFPAGRRAGIVLHELFEKLDFGATRDEVHARVSELLLRERMATDESDGRIDAVANMAVRVLGTVLPGAHFALRDIPRGVTLREWEFHLPLGPADGNTLADLFARHGGAVARRYAPALRAIAPERVFGFLTGVIDLAFVHDGRWYVVDWKSNHLGTDVERYEPVALEHEMFASHYVLQYHLYVAALHRFLRARVPGYSYERDIGGVWYTFLRGVDGSTRGWFADRPAEQLVDALGDLMDAGTASHAEGTAA